MIHFHSLTVEKVERETDDCISISFHVPGDLQTIFRFRSGQSLTIRKQLNGEELRRTYSICSSPFDRQLKVAVKKVEGGLFSTWANEQLKPGDTLEVMPPVGKFYTELHAGQAKNYMAFAAGSGITPVLSLIKTTLLTEPHSRFTLVYGNQHLSSVMFHERLQDKRRHTAVQKSRRHRFVEMQTLAEAGEFDLQIMAYRNKFGRQRYLAWCVAVD